MILKLRRRPCLSGNLTEQLSTLSTSYCVANYMTRRMLRWKCLCTSYTTTHYLLHILCVCSYPSQVSTSRLSQVTGLHHQETGSLPSNWQGDRCFYLSTAPVGEHWESKGRESTVVSEVYCRMSKTRLSWDHKALWVLSITSTTITHLPPHHSPPSPSLYLPHLSPQMMFVTMSISLSFMASSTREQKELTRMLK